MLCFCKYKGLIFWSRSELLNPSTRGSLFSVKSLKSNHFCLMLTWRKLFILICHPVLIRTLCIKYSVKKRIYKHLHVVQNAAARLLTETKRRERTALILESLHWFQLLLLLLFVVKCLLKTLLFKLTFN